MSKRTIGNYKFIAAAIAGVLVVHFAWQFSFSQRENLREIETSLKSVSSGTALNEEKTVEPKAEIKVDVQPDTLESENELVETNSVESKSVETAKSSESESLKIVQKAAHRTPEVKNAPKTVGKKASRETEAERLRRAEKLLTGM